MISKPTSAFLAFASIATLALCSAGCSSSSKSSGSPGGEEDSGPGGGETGTGTCSGTAMTHAVTVGANGTLAFSPSTLTICPGDTVEWTWMGSGHNVVSGTNGMSDGKFCNQMNTNCASAPTESSGNTYSFTFTTAGSYPYFCRPHASLGMTGTITVQ